MKRSYQRKEDADETRMLVDELTASAAATGANSRLTGFLLTKVTSKLMKKNVEETGLVVPLPFDEAVRRVTDVLEEAGQSVEAHPLVPGADRRTIRVLAHGGIGGLNPVVVTASLTRGPGSRTEVGLRAAAMEGLVKQRTAEEMADRLAALLNG
ncbi:hypothetical protein [Streptomyces sp. NBC_00102]|uniref:hypothetical protein n=1 Tax=Streptomyces sp. NBC_00102 TaxID=2975652 RepID=UPI002254AEC1|nr:hypothetical protein [Streptomyces sp. NBC_00102]MCX5397741.1 hypothetical protein [Streptomyces sp. NBC_00102]